MPEYQEILDTEVQPEAPLTSSLGVRFRDNPEAVWEGAPSAPRINGQQGPAVNTNGLFDSAVTQGKLASNAAGRSELKMGTNSVSGSISASSFATVNLTDYSLFPSIETQTTEVRVTGSTNSASASNPRFVLFNVNTDLNRSYAVAWRFVQS